MDTNEFAAYDRLVELRTRRECRCCHQFETFGKDGLCGRCRIEGCWVWEFEPKVGVKA